jgi:hypothetical protein
MGITHHILNPTLALRKRHARREEGRNIELFVANYQNALEVDALV